MKHLKKIIAVVLTAVLMSSLLLPIVSFAEAGVPGDHTTFDEFWEQMTDEDGNIDWTRLPKVLLKAFVWVRIFEVIANFFRNLFGLSTPDTETPEETTAAVAEETTVAAEVTTVAEVAA